MNLYKKFYWNKLANSAGGSGAAFPLNLSPLVWFDPSDAATVTVVGGNAISQINDKSGHGYHLTQTDNNYRSAHNITQNGLRILGGGAGAYMVYATNSAPANAFNALHDGTKWLLAAVFNPGVFNENSNGFFGTASRSSAQVGVGVQSNNSDGTQFHVVNNNFTVLTADGVSGWYAYNTINVTTMLVDAANATAALRMKGARNAGALAGANAQVAAVSAGNSTSTLVLGNSGSSSDLLTNVGRIGEFIIVTGANATEDNRVLLRDYLNAKWAVY